jgi:polysaccharide export outer membrane protein
MPRLIARLMLGATLIFMLSLGADHANAQSYQIRAGDILRIEVLEDPELNRSVLVTPDGRISVPMAGTLRASGHPVEDVQRNLTGRLAGSFANPPNVFVSVERLAERGPQSLQPKGPKLISVFVMGEANKPGMIEIPPGTNVLQAFAVMGGFTKFAALKRIQLRRADKIVPLNYRQIEAGLGGARTTLQDGDVIVVPQRRLFE